MIDWVLIGKLAYDSAQIVTLIIVIVFGGRDERVGCAILVFAGGATAVNSAISVYTRFPARYGLFAIDLLALIGFDALMVRSRRFWPVWATGVQLAAVMLDLAKIVTVTRNSHLWVQGKFAYLLMLFLLLGCLYRPKARLKS